MIRMNANSHRCSAGKHMISRLARRSFLRDEITSNDTGNSGVGGSLTNGHFFDRGILCTRNVTTGASSLSVLPISPSSSNIATPLLNTTNNEDRYKPLMLHSNATQPFSSLALKQEVEPHISSSSPSSPSPSHTATTTTTTRQRPRLNELRKRLQRQSIEEDVKILKNDTNNSKTSPSIHENNTTKTSSKPSWEDVLALAKSHYSYDDNYNENINDNKVQERIKEEMLTDSFSRKHSYLRISLVERCNLRCKYCMPPEGVPLQKRDRLLDVGEIDRLVGLFSSHGVDKVRLTGGEPLLRKDITKIISSISSRPNVRSVGITTNGITLSRQLPRLLDAGLTHANISLDTLDESRFLDVTRRKGLSQVRRAIEDACRVLPEGNVKLNCVVMNGFNDDELRDFILLTRDLPLDVRFIEWMPFNDNGWSKNRFLSYRDMMNRIQGTSDNDDDDVGSSRSEEIDGVLRPSSLHGVPPIELLRSEDGPNDTTKWWKAEESIGRVGFITSMSQNFCGTCNRLRITADGQLKVCLFGSTEVSLRDAMRSGVNDEELGLIVRAALQKKHFALGGHGSAEGIKAANDNRPMTLIGG